MKKTIQFLDQNFEKIICVALISIMTIIIFLQVICRRVFGHSLSWSEEIARYMFVWLCYVGTAYGIKERKHICVEAFTAWLSPKGQKIVSMIGDIIFFIFAGFIIYASYTNVIAVAKSGKLSPALQQPMAYVYYGGLLIGYVMAFIRLVQAIAEDVASLIYEKKIERGDETT